MTGDTGSADPVVVPFRRVGSWVVAAVLLLLLAGLVSLVASGGGVRWSEIPQYLLDPTILAGVRLTITFTVMSMLLSTAGGLALAIMRLSANPVLSGLARLYVWFFRATPLLVQIIFWFNIQLFIPRIHLLGYDIRTNSLISAFTAALLALTLNESAYMAEIFRGGLLAMERGQSEAAVALGFTPRQVMRRIVLPQALRVTVPAIGNQTISMLKTTSLVSVVAAQDLLTRAQSIYARNFLIIELLIVASLWYLTLTSVASVLQSALERRLDTGDGRSRSAAGTRRRVKRRAGVQADGAMP